MELPEMVIQIPPALKAGTNHNKEVGLFSDLSYGLTQCPQTISFISGFLLVQ
jgi:hypothetical protein